MRGSNPGSKNNFSLLQNVLTGSGPQSPLLNAYRGSFLQLKRPRREADHLPATSSEVKNERRHTSTSSIRFQGVDRDTFKFNSTIQ
jgi:hypothetical protein